MQLLLLPYATTTQALSATTVQVIHGTQPYLTFDNGVTKVTTTEDLLGIKLSNGARFTPATNTSTAANPIQLPEANQSFTDIGMLVPATTNSITLNTLIGAPYNYWGDDDGDGQGRNGIIATGNLSVSITDKNGQAVSRNTVLSLCDGAPYKVALTSTAGSLTTQYGLPNSSSFSGDTATYYISPKAAPTICYARPNLKYSSTNRSGLPGTWKLDGPATIWNPTKGFLVQSTESSGYSRNFPTTGANNLYFDLDIGGVNGSELTWPTVSQGGITATMTPSPDNANNIRVTFTGPAATVAQQQSATPGSIASPTLPQTFVLVGKDSSNNEVLKYGFQLRRWFVNRGTKKDTVTNHSSWCRNLGSRYDLPLVKYLTNAKCGVNIDDFPCRNGVDGNRPFSPGNYSQRNIGLAFFTEWGNMSDYTDAGFGGMYWTSDRDGTSSNFHFLVKLNGFVYLFGSRTDTYRGVCAYP